MTAKDLDAKTANSFSADVMGLLKIHMGSCGSDLLLAYPSISRASVRNAGRYWIAVLRTVLSTRPETSGFLLRECLKLLSGVEDEKANAEMICLEVFSALVTLTDITDSTASFAEALREFIATLQFKNLMYLDGFLVYSVMYFSTKDTLPMIMKNLDFVLKLLSQEYSRILIQFVVNMLMCAFIHDSNLQFHPLCPNMTQNRTGLSLASMIDLPFVVDLCRKPTNMVVLAYRASLMSLALMCGADASTCMDVLSQIRSLSHENKEDVNDRLAYLLCLLPIMTTRHDLIEDKLSTEQITFLVSEYYTELVNALIDSNEYISKLASNYGNALVYKPRLTTTHLQSLPDHLLEMIHQAQKPKEIKTIMNLLTIIISVRQFTFTEETTHQVIHAMIDLLQHPFTDVRNAAQDNLTILLYFTPASWKQSLYQQYKPVLKKRGVDSRMLEQAIRMISALVMDDFTGCGERTRDAMSMLVYFTSDQTEINSLVSDTMEKYRRMHMKRMFKLKAVYDEDDWEMLNTNNKFISYFL